MAEPEEEQETSEEPTEVEEPERQRRDPRRWPPVGEREVSPPHGEVRG